MLTLYITLPINVTSEERRYVTNLFEAQFHRQIASHMQHAPGLSWNIEIELPELAPFTDEQVRYLRYREFRLVSTPERECAICEPATEKMRVVENVE